MTAFTQNLKNAMDAAHMSQTELAAKAHVSKSAVSQYLTGQNAPKSDTMARLAFVLGTTTEALINKEGPIETISANRISTRTAARRLGKSEHFVRIGLQRGILPFGSAVPGTGKKFIYYINPAQFRDYAGPDRFDRFFGV